MGVGNCRLVVVKGGKNIVGKKSEHKPNQHLARHSTFRRWGGRNRAWFGGTNRETEKFGGKVWWRNKIIVFWWEATGFGVEDGIN